MSGCPFKNLGGGLTRRGFFKALGGAGLFAAGAATGPQLAQHLLHDPVHGGPDDVQKRQPAEPFRGRYQAGIVSPQPEHTYFAAFDVNAARREDVTAMLQKWTLAAERMTSGKTAVPLDADRAKPATDTGEALSLPSARLTLTFGFGRSLFVKDGKDRFGLAALRPAALVDMPKFNGDQLIPERSGGDISVQACADDPQVAFHAIRQLARIAGKTAQMRWAQTGFISGAGVKDTPRNLQGFKDGTQNPTDRQTMDKFVWVGQEGPDWMQGGSYVVARRIRIALEHWDNTDVDFQEQVIGRRKDTGAPLGKQHEFEPLGLERVDKDGNPVIPENAHVRLANFANNDGAQILRRAYSYNDGVNFIAERWPPWRQAIEYDAGLFFLCYQSDPRTGFIKIFDNMAKLDALNQFTTHNASALFACPGGVGGGEYIGQKLFQAA